MGFDIPSWAMYVAGALVILFALSAVSKLFNRGSGESDSSKIRRECGGCGWKGTVSKFHKKCPNCGAPLG